VEIKGKDVGKNVGAGRNGMADVGPDIERIVGFVCSLARAVAIGTVQAREAGPADPIAWSRLLREAQRTEQPIPASGPFPYSKDGGVFASRARRLERRRAGMAASTPFPVPARRIAAHGAFIAAETAPRNPMPAFIPKTTTTAFIGS
jgi:hypothetical protein